MLRNDHPFGKAVDKAVVIPAEIRATAMLSSQRSDIMLDQTEVPPVIGPEYMSAARCLQPQREVEVAVPDRVGEPIEPEGVPLPLLDKAALSAHDAAARKVERATHFRIRTRSYAGARATSRALDQDFVHETRDVLIGIEKACAL